MTAAGPNQRWVALGASGHARSVEDALHEVATMVAVVGESATGWHQATVLDTDPDGIAWAREHDARILVTIGDNVIRMKVLDGIPRELLLAAAAPTATVARDVELGPGTVVLHHAHVGPGTSIGAGIIVNTAAVVEHDCFVGDGSHIAPGARVLGGCVIGEGVLIGSGATVLPGRKVGAGATIGAGALVTKDVKDREIVKGVTQS